MLTRQLSLTALLVSVSSVLSFHIHPHQYHGSSTTTATTITTTTQLHMSSSAANEKSTAIGIKLASDAFLIDFFSDCDDSNMPPRLSRLLQSISRLQSGSDIRGVYMDRLEPTTGTAALTPMAAHCLGYAFGTMLKDMITDKESVVKICIGMDPRPHGPRIVDGFARGAESVEGVKVVFTGIATTPAMFEFCRSDFCDGGVMATASHLPVDRNGFKFFTKENGGFTKHDVARLVELASLRAQYWHDMGTTPPKSGDGAVFCSEWVDWMPNYASTLSKALVREVGNIEDKPLAGLKIVLNSGNGSGGFFHDVLLNLGADVSASIHIEPNGAFPAYVPNPETSAMVHETIQVCETSNADIGIMFDTDADRCGFVVPRTIAVDGTKSNYEPLNRNRLIALLGVIFSRTSPGSAVVTDSVTSEGLATFLQDDLGLLHVRYLKGYANVIGRAQELTNAGVANAELAIETSGHCAMKENGYLDDGTYTAVKVVGLLARSKQDQISLLDYIADMKEMPECGELRMDVMEGCSTANVFDVVSMAVEQLCTTTTSSTHGRCWSLDEENLEGIRARDGRGGFFMLRKSLHDPLISLQYEGTSTDEIRNVLIDPMLKIFRGDPVISQSLNLSPLEAY